MKKSPLIWFLISLVGLLILGASSQIANANDKNPYQGSKPRDELAAANTPPPTVQPVSEVSLTPEIRVLPPVGSNAGLVLGASLLVLIIVGGVLGIQLRKKH
jgi:hypothetical protein